MTKILFLGDIIGSKGIDIAVKNIKEIKENEKPDFIIVNIENSGLKGKGISEEAIKKFSEIGVSVFTGGNHSFGRKETYHLYQQNKNLLRPCNYPNGAPGTGYILTTIPSTGEKILIINVQLRVFMREQLGCPFKAVESIIQLYKDENPYILIDMHGEASAEKITFGYYFDGVASAVFGTHTHVQTADERVLPKKTAYITDVGMTGALNSSIGVKLSGTIYNFVTQLPAQFEIEEEMPFVSCGIIINLNKETKKSNSIKRIYRVFE